MRAADRVGLDSHRWQSPSTLRWRPQAHLGIGHQLHRASLQRPGPEIVCSYRNGGVFAVRRYRQLDHGTLADRSGNDVERDASSMVAVGVPVRSWLSVCRRRRCRFSFRHRGLASRFGRRRGRGDEAMRRRVPDQPPRPLAVLAAIGTDRAKLVVEEGNTSRIPTIAASVTLLLEYSREQPS